jgi:adenine-specific DNA-methyltransferase
MGFRYIGAKTKIIAEVLDKIASITGKGSHVIDLMCGTGAVSAALRERGFKVTAVDMMTFSYHHARIQLLLNEPPAFENAQEFIDNTYPKHTLSLFPLSPYEMILSCLNEIKPIKGYFWKEFSLAGKPKNTEKPRNYFTTDNAKKIDAIRKCIKDLRISAKINDIEHSLLLHDLIMAANDIANIAGTYGHYLSKTVGRAKSPILLKPTLLKQVHNNKKHKILLGQAEVLANKLSGDLCYIDPPYMKRQYAANYHILETLAREDEPEAIGVSGLRPWRDQYSNFCTKTKIRESFRKILSDMDCSNYLISYSEDGLLKIHELEEVFSEYGKVEISTLMNKRFKSNASQLNQYLTEYLIYLKTKK